METGYKAFRAEPEAAPTHRGWLRDRAGDHRRDLPAPAADLRDPDLLLRPYVRGGQEHHLARRLPCGLRVGAYADSTIALSVDGSRATASARVGGRAGQVLKSPVARRTPPWLRREAPAVLILMVVAAVNVAILVLGHRTYFAAPDNTDQFWAWYQKADAVLHSGVFPLWDANTLAGHSFVGESSDGSAGPIEHLVASAPRRAVWDWGTAAGHARRPAPAVGVGRLLRSRA